MPEPTPEAWAQIRHAYENTDQPIVEICAEHGITAPMLRYRVKRWKWKMRKPVIPRHGPPPVPVVQQEIAAPAPNAVPIQPVLHTNPPAFAGAPAGDPPPSVEGDENATIVPRLQGAVARVLPAIEATIARLAGGTHDARDVERAGRTLSTLMRTLRELNTLLAQHNARPDDFRCECREMSPEDMDTFRDDLARRIRAFVASRTDAENLQPGSALPQQVQK